ncbi:MAG: hypothetical protein LBT13_00440 [Treponema sp.]|nr:hypothetical protein [Treponema sp.]
MIQTFKLTDIIETCSFNATSVSLENYGIGWLTSCCEADPKHGLHK